MTDITYLIINLRNGEIVDAVKTIEEAKQKAERYYYAKHWLERDIALEKYQIKIIESTEIHWN